MKSLYGCNRYIIPVKTLLSRKINRSASVVLRFSRHSRTDHHFGQSCSRHLHLARAAAVAEQTTHEVRDSNNGLQHKPAFRAFLDFKALKADLDKHTQNCKNRNSAADPQKVASLYDQYCEATQRVDRTREDRNSNAKAMKVQPEHRCVVPKDAIANPST